MNYVPNPKSSHPFRSRRQQGLENLFKLMRSCGAYDEPRPFGSLAPIFQQDKSHRSRAKRQGKSRKDIIMYERDIACQMKKDAYYFLDKPEYTKKTRRLFNQGLSNWNLTINEEVL